MMLDDADALHRSALGGFMFMYCEVGEKLLDQVNINTAPI